MRMGSTMNPYRHTPADRARQTRRDETEAFIRANVRGDAARPTTGKRYEMLVHPLRQSAACGSERLLRDGLDDPGKFRTCERVAGHDGWHEAMYDGKKRRWR